MRAIRRPGVSVIGCGRRVPCTPVRRWSSRAANRRGLDRAIRRFPPGSRLWKPSNPGISPTRPVTRPPSPSWNRPRAIGGFAQVDGDRGPVARVGDPHHGVELANVMPGKLTWRIIDFVHGRLPARKIVMNQDPVLTAKAFNDEPAGDAHDGPANRHHIVVNTRPRQGLGIRPVQTATKEQAVTPRNQDAVPGFVKVEARDGGMPVAFERIERGGRKRKADRLERPSPGGTGRTSGPHGPGRRDGRWLIGIDPAARAHDRQPAAQFDNLERALRVDRDREQPGIPRGGRATAPRPRRWDRPDCGDGSRARYRAAPRSGHPRIEPGRGPDAPTGRSLPGARTEHRARARSDRWARHRCWSPPA